MHGLPVRFQRGWTLVGQTAAGLLVPLRAANTNGGDGGWSVNVAHPWLRFFCLEVTSNRQLKRTMGWTDVGRRSLSGILIERNSLHA